MRGKAVFGALMLIGIRITPAYAGKRIFRTDAFLYLQDHPRLCGEKSRSQQLQYSWWGSPPPMRGKDKHQHLEICTQRITPAYAGKSVNVKHATRVTQDHPRLCGEKA